MRQFASSGFRLWHLGKEAKVLYSAFCLLTLLGIGSSALYYVDLVGVGTRGVRAYYAGDAASGGGAPASATPGGRAPPAGRPSTFPPTPSAGSRSSSR